MSGDTHATGLLAGNTIAAAWWVGDILMRHGPDWQIVPPILIGAASFVGALRGLANDRQTRRHREEIHRLEVEARKRTPLP